MINDISNIFLRIKNKDMFNSIMKKVKNKNLTIDGLRFYLNKVEELTNEDISMLEDYFFKTNYRENIVYGNKVISIIIPTYNKGHIIVESIESILRQSYKNFEIIIIDDFSTDRTEDIIKNKYKNESRIKYYKNIKNIGSRKSQKKGYNLSRGDYVIFMNDDDFYIDNDFFTNCINLYSRHNNISFIVGDMIVYYEGNISNNIEIRELNLPPEIDKNNYFLEISSGIIKRKPPTTLSVMHNRRNLEYVEVNHMDGFGDIDLYQRALLGGNALSINSIVAVFRRHKRANSYSLRVEEIIETLDAIKSTKQLSCQKFGYDKEFMNNVFDKTFNLCIDWYKTVSTPTNEQIEIVNKWLRENNI
ncbi:MULTISPECIES: glycosyltransferase family 2 protein [unclassified Romboutsia]|uniref:glycosyltransferase family 2 protein n=1 Tax=unclassified Romboutsia TaxID=2626894 RepID=UPI000F0696AB|nr:MULTISPECIES: glycosyltransferase family 2 protein [unclassified Romboutsia]